jgi:hypothetical protein
MSGRAHVESIAYALVSPAQPSMAALQATENLLSQVFQQPAKRLFKSGIWKI